MGKDRMLTRSKLKISMALYLVPLVIGLYFFFSGISGKYLFTDTELSYRYNAPVRDAYGNIKNITVKKTDRAPYLTISGACFIISGIAGLISVVGALSCFDELGIDAMRVSDYKEYRKNKKRQGTQTRNQYNSQAQRTQTRNQYNNQAQRTQTRNTYNSQAQGPQTRNTYNSQAQSAQTPNYNIIETCPACNQKLRLPTGKGQLEVTCPRCKYSFYVKT